MRGRDYLPTPPLPPLGTPSPTSVSVTLWLWQETLARTAATIMSAWSWRWAAGAAIIWSCSIIMRSAPRAALGTISWCQMRPLTSGRRSCLPSYRSPLALTQVRAYICPFPSLFCAPI